jgi:sugar fermentation stimulation protein A
LTHPSQILSEVAYGKENSRIDFVVEFDHQPSCYVEVKSVTLEDQGVGYFPDAVSIRGQKHLRELTELSKQGKRAMLIYLVQHSGISRMNLNSEVDPTYSSLLNHAVQAGVSIACYSCEICQSNIHLNQPVPFTLSASS